MITPPNAIPTAPLQAAAGHLYRLLDPYAWSPPQNPSPISALHFRPCVCTYPNTAGALSLPPRCAKPRPAAEVPGYGLSFDHSDSSVRLQKSNNIIYRLGGPQAPPRRSSNNNGKKIVLCLLLVRSNT